MTIVLLFALLLQLYHFSEENQLEKLIRLIKMLRL